MVVFFLVRIENIPSPQPKVGMTLVVDHSGRVFSKKKPTIKDLIANHEDLGYKSRTENNFSVMTSPQIFCYDILPKKSKKGYSTQDTIHDKFDHQFCWFLRYIYIYIFIGNYFGVP